MPAPAVHSDHVSGAHTHGESSAPHPPSSVLGIPMVDLARAPSCGPSPDDDDEERALLQPKRTEARTATEAEADAEAEAHSEQIHTGDGEGKSGGGGAARAGSSVGAEVLHERYLPSTAVVLMELVKLLFSLSMLLVGFRIASRVPLRSLPAHVGGVLGCRAMLLMGVPGLLYYCMNQLVFISLSYLDSSTFALISQLKLITAALFGRLLIGKKLYWFQHRALLLLIIGVMLVQGGGGETQPKQNTHTDTGSIALQPMKTSNDSSSIAGDVPPSVSLLPAPLRARRRLLFASPNATASGVTAVSLVGLGATLPIPSTTGAAFDSAAAGAPPVDSDSDLDSGSVASSDRFVGVASCLCICVLSGFCGAFVEQQLKSSTTSLTIWDRNVQLAVWGVLFGAAQILFGSSAADSAFVAEYGWLGGFSWFTMVVLSLNVAGGILVSLVLAYLDNIVRGFATSIGIVTTAFVSYHVFHDVTLSLSFCCGVAAVLLSVLNYQEHPNQPPLD